MPSRTSSTSASPCQCLFSTRTAQRLCAGTHVSHTAEIGRFRISSSRYQDGVQRLVFKLD
ncbi:MAG: hypothetical protein K2N28_04095 [Muribaculaceae bacterium]|nr:hypothetical protein [Muribaculaceae bacterium]